MGVGRIGVRDNFFELGGHSLMAVRLLARIQVEFKKTLPLILLFQNGTVEAIAKALAPPEQPRLQPGIHPFQTEGTETPLFIIAAGMEMRELTLALAPTRPVFGLNPVENDRMVYRKSVQETAKILQQNLVDCFPRGPYLLLGHSAFGYFTLELARLLIRDGQKVPFIGLLDSFPPYYKPRDMPLLDRVRFHKNELMQKNILENLQYFGYGVQRIINRWWRRVTRKKMIERYEKEDQPREVRRLLIRSYEPEPLPTQVTVFATAHPGMDMHGDPMELWVKTFGNRLNIIRVPGDHFTMLEPPHVAVLAEKIEAALSSAALR